MTKLRLAHIREQGQDMIIIPLDDSFGRKTNAEQNTITQDLQLRARSAGLAGTVVPVWNADGRMGFIAPRPWCSFFQSISLHWVLRNINKELSFS
jgi:hypothetical protein